MHVIYCGTVGVKKEILVKKVADLDVKGRSNWIIMTGQIYYHLCGFTGDAEALAVFFLRLHTGWRASVLPPCVSDMGAIILIWARLNQMSNLQNYKITVLAGTVTRVNFSLISLLPEDICFFSMVFYLSSPFLSSGRVLCFNSISSAVEHPGNYLFLQGRRGSMCS